jgi:hypothetical protein
MSFCAWTKSEVYRDHFQPGKDNKKIKIAFDFLMDKVEKSVGYTTETI